MKFRFAVAAAAALTTGLVLAQTPMPTPTPNAAPAAAPAVVQIPAAPAPSTATAWLVMDHASGQVLAGENIHTALPPASITKVTSPAVIRISALTAICFSVVGKLSALLQSIPQAVQLSA